MTKKLKDLIVKNPEPARGTVGVDPSNPWSAKSNLAEGALDQYLLSRGINPKFVSTQTKISHAKSSAFLKWKQNHQFEEVQQEIEEIAEKKMMDNPCWKGYQAIGMKNKNGKKVPNCVPEEKELEEGRMKDLATDASETQRLNKMSTLQKFRADSAARAKKHSDIEKNSGGMTSAIDRLEKHLNKEEVEQIDEISKSTLSSYRDKARTSLKTAQTNRDAAEPGKDMSKGFADLHAKSNATAKKRVKGLMGYLQRKQGIKPTSENTLDPMAATEAPCDGANGGETNAPSKKSEMSKSARMIKSLYRHLNMKEETYDWEKDDKAQNNGKKPKISVPDADRSMGETKPEARVVMSGGTTLTGEKRDTVEIDPLMKNRAGPPDSFTKEQGKKGQ